ncbi:hypothetical protein PV325_008502 [Microctonus aethiopoides]|uniref:Uncharacterized protein n=1 Tax=Microctonus aethiopoides TaxID=144406 RepID=A0AA39KKT7_9HYME|nr:hypothetical protein PV325_008502 [Microctonus aethiopoides]KAK0097958.1 hypothetical protein PV326_012356 [Microctonus aethiopoides]KAK0165026.1 hypothetical protein PV328_003583 [Microctonus aethiopoides]
MINLLRLHSEPKNNKEKGKRSRKSQIRTMQSEQRGTINTGMGRYAWKTHNLKNRLTEARPSSKTIWRLPIRCPSEIHKRKENLVCRSTIVGNERATHNILVDWLT